VAACAVRDPSAPQTPRLRKPSAHPQSVVSTTRAARQCSPAEAGPAPRGSRRRSTTAPGPAHVEHPLRHP